jgi:hypothetical protein
VKEGFKNTDFLKNTFCISEGVSYTELCPNLTENIENKGKILIIPLSGADLHRADIHEILQREICCSEFLPNCRKYEKCWVEKYEVH